jgi:acetyl esterase/lipase
LSSRHLVDPELLRLLDLIPGDFLRAETLEAARGDGTRAKAPAAALPEGLHEWRETIAGPADAPSVPLLLVGPNALGPKVVGERAPAILYLHGGGYVSGSPDQSREALVELALATGALVVAPRYRLAPETPFPGGLEDCYAVLKWLPDEAPSLGVAADAIAVVGASAGGGLAAAVCLLARDRGEVTVRLQVLISPMLDDRTGASIDRDPYAGEFVWTAGSNQFGWRSLLGEEAGGPDVSPYAAPARVTDLARLAPTLMMVGALDLLLEEDLDHASRLARAGVPLDACAYYRHHFAAAGALGTRHCPRPPFPRRTSPAKARAHRAAGMRMCECVFGNQAADFASSIEEMRSGSNTIWSGHDPVGRVA